MPFGKYKGLNLEEIPLSYLEWLHANADLKGRLRSEVRRQLDYMGGTPAVLEIDTVRIREVYRQLAFEFHPDRGGSTEAMKAVNRFYELLAGEMNP